MILLNYDNLFDFHRKYRDALEDSANAEYGCSCSRHLAQAHAAVSELIALRQKNLALQTENGARKAEMERLREQSAKLEARQQSVLQKLGALRAVQMDSELARRWSEALGDLEAIAEDDEFFLDSRPGSKKSVRAGLFNASQGSSVKDSETTALPCQGPLAGGALESLGRRVQTFNFEVFDRFAAQKAKSQVGSVGNAAQRAETLIALLETRVAELQRNVELLLLGNGGRNQSGSRRSCARRKAIRRRLCSASGTSRADSRKS